MENENKQTENVKKPITPTTTPSKKKVIKKSPNDEFKRRYFDYYDDIKISDRQDW